MDVKYDGVLSYGYGIIPLMVLVDKRLNDGDKTVYGILANHARGFERTARPLQKSMAEMLGVEVPTISIHTTNLEDCGYIEKIKGGKGRMEYLMTMNIKGQQQDLFPDIITKRKEKKKKSVATGIGEVLGRIETIYFDLYMSHNSNPKKMKPDYKYGKDRGILKRYLKKYDEETVGNLIRAFFKNSYAEKRGFTFTIFQHLANELILEIGKGGGKGFAGFKKSGQAGRQEK